MLTLEFDLEHVYPDDPARGIGVPVRIEAGDRSARLLAYVDTGAGYCVFQSDYAELLGLQLTDGTPIQLTPAGGGTIEAYGHTVIVEAFERRVESIVYFTNHPGFRRNVLGRQGWLHHFRFGLVHYQSKLYLGSLLRQE